MDEQAKKTALRLFTYGLYVGTAGTGDDIAAGTINWVSQASFKPPLVMVAIKADSHLHQLTEKAHQFVINILGAEQKEIAQDFFRPTHHENQSLNGHPYEPSPRGGIPLLKEVPAWVQVQVSDIVKQGDHSIFVGEVIDAGVHDDQAKALDMWNTGWFYAG